VASTTQNQRGGSLRPPQQLKKAQNQRRGVVEAASTTQNQRGGVVEAASTTQNSSKAAPGSR
jgi:hypothetical protein